MAITINNIKYKTGGIVSNGATIYTKYKFLYQTELIFFRAGQEGFVIPSLGTKLAIDQKIRGLINQGVWDKMDIYFNFAYNNTALNNFSKINWKDPLGTLATTLGGISYTASGWAGNGADAYINTSFTPTIGTNNYTMNNASRGAILFVNNANANVNIAAIDGLSSGTQNSINAVNTTVQRINSGSNSLAVNVDLTGIGLKGIVRTSATEVSLYNRSVQTNVTSNSGSVVASPQMLFRRSNSYANLGLSNYWMGGAVTTAEVAAMRTIENAFLLTIGLTAFA